jgi:formylglycine-generating enzyme required for sulfatase activity
MSGPARLPARIGARWTLAGLTALSALVGGCANLVGITDTEVTSDGGADALAGADATIGSDSPSATGDAAGDAPDADASHPMSEAGPDGTLADAPVAVDGRGGGDAGSAEGAVGSDASNPTDAGNGGDATAADAADAGAGADQASPDSAPPGPTLVPVSTFSIDSTEVTVAQYKVFLAAKGSDTSGQPSVCSWNTSYYDSSHPMNPDAFPVNFVDWCDALAYCTWAGKHLCGKIGGGSIAYADLYTPNLSQWFLACGGPGGASHPSNADMCNSNGGFGNLAPVATFPGCEGFYPGIFDLEGNAAEWVDSCDPPEAGSNGSGDTCHLMGGSFIDDQSYCDEVGYDNPRSTLAVTFGFRCCSG